jgi:uncharacterized protein (DUF2164 family)
MADKKTIKTPFGELPIENDVINMSNSQLMEEYEKRGLANAAEVCKEVHRVEHEVAEAAAKFLLDKTAKDLKDYTFKAGLKDNRIEVQSKVSQKITIPGRNGEAPKSDVRYGVVVTKRASLKLTEILADEDYKKTCATIQKAVEAKEKNAPRVKVVA